jgi:hypothetical protein
VAKYELYLNECVSAERSIAEEPKAHGYIVTGYGNQIFTVVDKTHVGKIWLWKSSEVENGFLDADGILIEQANEKYLAQLIDYQWEITTKKRMSGLIDGDFVNFHSPNHGIEELSVATIERNSNGDLKLELGARSPNRADAWEAEQDIGSGYSDSYMVTSHKSISGVSDSTSKDTREFYPSDPSHSLSPGGDIKFWIPHSILASKLHPRITMRLSIDALASTDLDFGSCALEIFDGEDYLRGGSFPKWTPGADIPAIDVTDWLEDIDDPVYSGLSDDVDLDDWPSSGGYRVEVVVSTTTGHTDVNGTITIGTEEKTISGADTYEFTSGFIEEPSIVVEDLDCHLRIYLVKKNVFTVKVTMSEEYDISHTSYTGHPRLSMSGTLQCWKRQDRSQ